MLQFVDGSLHSYSAAEISRPVRHLEDRTWTEACDDGAVQRLLESIVTLTDMSHLVEALDGDERLIAQAIERLLGDLAKAVEPPESLVVTALKWLGHKADLFLESAVETAGKAFGVGVVGAAGIAAGHFLPNLIAHIRELLELAGRPQR